VSGSLVCASNGPVGNKSDPASKSRYMVEPCCYGVTWLSPTAVARQTTELPWLRGRDWAASGTGAPERAFKVQKPPDAENPAEACASLTQRTCQASLKTLLVAVSASATACQPAVLLPRQAILDRRLCIQPADNRVVGARLCRSRATVVAAAQRFGCDKPLQPRRPRPAPASAIAGFAAKSQRLAQRLLSLKDLPHGAARPITRESLR